MRRSHLREFGFSEVILTSQTEVSRAEPTSRRTAPCIQRRGRIDSGPQPRPPDLGHAHLPADSQVRGVYEIDSLAALDNNDHNPGRKPIPDAEAPFGYAATVLSGAMVDLIAFFFTGWKHAGEDLRDVLVQRASQLGPPIQMCDALSRNLPGELKTILANCLAHARRKFADVVQYFDREVGYVLKALAVIYQNDTDARNQNLSPEARLQWHQAKSASATRRLRFRTSLHVNSDLLPNNAAV